MASTTRDTRLPFDPFTRITSPASISVRTRAIRSSGASALSPRADLRRLVRGERELPVLDGWRRALVGERLLECLGGECAAGPAQEPVAKGDSVSSS